MYEIIAISSAPQLARFVLGGAEHAGVHCTISFKC